MQERLNDNGTPLWAKFVQTLFNKLFETISINILPETSDLLKSAWRPSGDVSRPNNRLAKSKVTVQKPLRKE